LVLAGLVSAGIARAQEEKKNEQAEPPRQKEEVRVVAPTPVDGMPIDTMHFPGNIQRIEVEAGGRAAEATEPLARSLGSVHLSGPQGNALEPDVFYRGFEASSLLGTPQGVSVYQDGVRLNETFGDTVHWALIPPGAIASVDLLPGSDPLFGQNTIGGSVSLHTKTGFDTAGTTATLSGGSFGRRAAALETGGRRGPDAPGRLQPHPRERHGAGKPSRVRQVGRLHAAGPRDYQGRPSRVARPLSSLGLDRPRRQRLGALDGAGILQRRRHALLPLPVAAGVALLGGA
jgi:outer membrane receptor protein involved in Fe transport